MPSGLTCKIYSGEDLTLRGFVLSCARQFGPGYHASQLGKKELPKDKAPILTVESYHEEKIIERHHFDNYIERFGIRIFAVVTHLDSLKNLFYYTRDGHSISTMVASLDAMIRFLKQEITSTSDVYIDRVYGSYRVNNFKLL